MRPTPVRRATALLRLALLAPLAACSVDGALADDRAQRVPGTYVLRSVDGAALPAVMAEDERGRLDVVGATRTLREDGTFSERFEFRYVSAADTLAGSNDVRGEYSLAGDSVVFVDAADGSRVQAALAAGGLSLRLHGQKYEYRK